MLVTLFASSVYGISSISWITIWLSIEVNTVSICFLLANDSNNEKENILNTINYFLVQITSSTIIIVSVSSHSTSSLITTVLVICLIINIGAWPFHLWYTSVISSTNLDNNSLILIITWQNVLPSILLSSLNLSITINSTILFLCLISITLPSYKINLFPSKILIALSSINNNGWIIVSAILSTNILIVFISIYTLTIWITIPFVNHKVSVTNEKISIILFYLFLFTNISGIPPLGIFWIKMIVIFSSVFNEVNNNFLILILVISCVMVSIYLILLMIYFFNNNNNTQNSNIINKNNNIISYTVGASALLLPYLLLLGFTSEDLSW